MVIFRLFFKFIPENSMFCLILDSLDKKLRYLVLKMKCTPATDFSVSETNNEDPFFDLKTRINVINTNYRKITKSVCLEEFI